MKRLLSLELGPRALPHSLLEEIVWALRSLQRVRRMVRETVFEDWEDE